MKLKCKARRYLSLFSCNCVSHMTNYVNFKLSKDVEKNPGPTQYYTDHHELIIRPFMQNHSSTMQLTSPISSENLMQSRLGELGLQSIDVGVQMIVSLDLYHINYMAIATIIWILYVICRLGGPYSEKLWQCCPRPQAEGSIFKTEITVFHYTDRPKPVNNLFIFFLSLKRLCLLTGKNSRKRYCDRLEKINSYILLGFNLWEKTQRDLILRAIPKIHG